MKRCDMKLKELLENRVLPDIEDALDEIFQEIAQNKEATMAQSEEREQLHEMREDFQSVLKDIENRELDKEECAELYSEISAMIEELEEDE